MYKIVKKERLNDVVELMEVRAPMVARKCEPGQFIILRVGEDGERIPLTIADYDREKETITIIYQIVGYSTKELAKLEEILPNYQKGKAWLEENKDQIAL